VEFLHGALPTTPEGYLVADEEMQTPVAGVFAAGDVRRPSVKQAVVAAADGAIAAMAADRFLHRRGKLVAQR
jgi:thioredoxin reductase (NADPH)